MYNSQVNVKVNDLKDAMDLYTLARTAKSEVAVERGQWRVVVVSPLGFFGLVSLKTNDPVVVMSNDADFIGKVKESPLAAE